MGDAVNARPYHAGVRVFLHPPLEGQGYRI
jgi:hypothetical protein